MTAAFEHGFPVVRSKDLVTQEVEDELLVYDPRSKDAHRLAPLAAVVFASADGNRSVTDIARLAGERLGEAVEVGRVEQALAELEARELIVVDGRAGVTRGAFLRRTAVAAASVPLVASIATPAYGADASPPLSNLSFVAAAFQVGTTVYWMKWGMGADTGLPDPNPECGGTMSLVCATMTPAATTSACLAGATVQEQLFTHQVTFTIPAGAKLVDFVLKCANDCVKPGQGGNAALPAGGASGPSYTTAGC
jgi:hypothetical protein